MFKRFYLLSSNPRIQIHINRSLRILMENPSMALIRMASSWFMSYLTCFRFPVHEIINNSSNLIIASTRQWYTEWVSVTHECRVENTMLWHFLEIRNYMAFSNLSLPFRWCWYIGFEVAEPVDLTWSDCATWNGICSFLWQTWTWNSNSPHGRNSCVQEFCKMYSFLKILTKNGFAALDASPCTISLSKKQRCII